MDQELRKMVARHDKWAATYDADISEMVLYNKITLDNIRRFLPDDRDSVILDAGGGTGFWAIQLAEMGYRVVLTDISPGMLDKARENVAAHGLTDRIEIIFSDIRNMPEFTDDQFSMVISEGDPVSYCGDHHAAVREFARVVHSGGMVVVSVDNRVPVVNWISSVDDIEVIVDYLANGNVRTPDDIETSFAIHAFTSEELRELFELNGLCVERIIGKPVIAKRLALAGSVDPTVQERLLQIELQYCDNPAYYPWGGHLEIAGRKR